MIPQSTQSFLFVLVSLLMLVPFWLIGLRKTGKEYEPPTVSQPYEGNPYLLAEGVIGVAIESEGTIYIPYIEAIQRGNGDVGRFISSLSSRCVFTTVTSLRLEEMLKRRGWVLSIERLVDPNYGDAEARIWRRGSDTM